MRHANWRTAQPCSTSLRHTLVSAELLGTAVGIRQAKGAGLLNCNHAESALSGIRGHRWDLKRRIEVADSFRETTLLELNNYRCGSFELAGAIG